MKYEDITVDLTLLTDADDGRHALRPDPLCRESLVYTIELPDEKIAGWVYPRVGSDGMAAGICCAFGEGVPGGSIFETFHDIPVPASMNFTEWNAGGVELKLPVPLRTAHIKYAGKRIAYDFTYEALHPAYSYNSHPDGCPQFFADNRFEQSGTVEGTLTIDGRIIPFKALGQRDHSWGARNWGVNYHYKWFHATTSESAVHFFKMEYLGRHLVRGYVFKDGHMSQIKSVDVLDFTLDDNMVHKDIDVVAYDIAGRTTKITGQFLAFQPLPVSDEVTLNEVAMTTTIDGKPGTGWCEMQWDNKYIAHMKLHKDIRR